MSDTVVIVPNRMASTRLPNKPLADINGKPLMIRALEQAANAGVGDVVAACCSQELVDLAEKHGYKAVLTPPECASGTDRVSAALDNLDKEYQYVINLQGDLPVVSPESIQTALKTLKEKDTDIGTIASRITEEWEKTEPSTVKAIIAANGRGLYFTRTPNSPYGDGELYHHIGIYAYKADSIKKFVQYPPSPLEKRESLEQLRALENGMTISVGVVDSFPIEVNTPEDLERVRQVAND